MNFKEIYKKNLNNIEKRRMGSVFSPKPEMYTGFISPESSIIVQPFFGFEFRLDQNGMEDILETFEKKWNSKSKAEKENFYNTLYDIYDITEKYLGGQGDIQARQQAYFQNGKLNLSDIKNKKIGICAERAAIGHQLISVLQQADFIPPYISSYYTLSNLHADTQSEPHALIVLENKKDKSRNILFDIENPLEFYSTNTNQNELGIGFYIMTEDEYNAFKEGKSISPKSIYEQNGMSLIGSKRFFGNEKLPLGNENY